MGDLRAWDEASRLDWSQHGNRRAIPRDHDHTTGLYGAQNCRQVPDQLSVVN
jgi:hypothetical protein